MGYIRLGKVLGWHLGLKCWFFVQDGSCMRLDCHDALETCYLNVVAMAVVAYSMYVEALNASWTREDCESEFEYTDYAQVLEMDGWMDGWTSEMCWDRESSRASWIERRNDGTPSQCVFSFGLAWIGLNIPSKESEEKRKNARKKTRIKCI